MNYINNECKSGMIIAKNDFPFIKVVFFDSTAIKVYQFDWVAFKAVACKVTL